MNFIALDVETANADMASICQIGLACYENGIITEEWKTYINPEDYFDAVNVAIHGIDEEIVRNAPKFSDIVEQLYSFLGERIVVTHTQFDRVAIFQVAKKYKLKYPDCIWLDSARVSRRIWKQFAWRGYGLQNICNFLNYNFKPHDALEDAKAAGFIILSAIKESKYGIDDLLKRVEQPIDISNQNKTVAKVNREGNPEGDLFGEVLVFTGALQIPRHRAADFAAKIGGKVATGVTQNTTILVVGDEDISKLAGYTKSFKHRKAEELICSGQKIKILKESDFLKLVNFIVPESEVEMLKIKKVKTRNKGEILITFEI